MTATKNHGSVVCKRNVVVLKQIGIHTTNAFRHPVSGVIGLDRRIKMWANGFGPRITE